LGAFEGFRNITDYYFYRAMTLLALYSLQSTEDQKIFLNEIHENYENLREYAENSPTNFRHRFTLLEAECARILGNMSTTDILLKYNLAAK
jgi:hypothetical protein